MSLPIDKMNAENLDPASVTLLKQALEEYSTGNLGRAERGFSNLLGLYPDHPMLLDAMSVLQITRGNFKVAEDLLTRLITQLPDVADLNARLGTLHQRMGRYPDAMADFQKALDADEGNVPALVGMAGTLRLEHRIDESAEFFRKALENVPSSTEAYIRVGSDLLAAGNPEHAMLAFERAVESDPQHAAALSALARVQLSTGDVDSAIATLERTIEVAPDDAGPHLELVEALERGNRTDDARAKLDEMRAAGLEHPMSALMDARLMLREGDAETAVSTLRTALASGELPDAALRGYQFLLGNALDAIDETDAAFDAFQSGNQTAQDSWRARRGVGNSYQLAVTELAGHFDQAWVSAFSELPVPDDGITPPVFLVGFPRSGTTLLGRMLDAHPSIRVMSERPVITRLGVYLNRQPGAYTRAIRDLSSEQRAACRALYARGVDAFEGPDEDRITIDAMPLATADVPMLSRVFPEAQFVFAARHPWAVIMSCFSQNFADSPAMANFHSLDDSVRMYEVVIGIWRRSVELLGIDHTVVRYEDLVDDPRVAVEPVLKMLELEWDEAVLEAATEPRSDEQVRTASYAQVAEPMYLEARDAWRRYQDRFLPYAERLDGIIEGFGYTE